MIYIILFLLCRHQHQLECALLGLGQFQNTLDELHTWLSRTAEQLQGSRPISIDLQACEIELAKHKVGGGLKTMLSTYYNRVPPVMKSEANMISKHLQAIHLNPTFPCLLFPPARCCVTMSCPMFARSSPWTRRAGGCWRSGRGTARMVCCLSWTNSMTAGSLSAARLNAGSWN